MTETATRTIEIGMTPRPRFVKATYDAADQILVDEMRPLGDAANSYGWYGPHGYKDLPDLMEDLHNRRNVLGAAFQRMRDETGRRWAYFVGTSSFTFPTSDITLAQREPGAKVIYLVERLGDELRFTEVA